ncbi:nitroreductase family protein [Kitasatospora purpeofusca]|uniref:Nitroreductase family protein n=1 Tax=Kitasatospora purpeofusca TaxID=67352 RepID=A0ABZ1TR99_9ACTN|nr:nitroreductase family protein [Kitasatospora purpeofusca]
MSDGPLPGPATEQPPLTGDQLLSTTRTVRRRLDLGRPVPVEVVTDCIRIAVQAPSAGNRQAWHWVVITDPGIREKIGQYYLRAFHDKYPAAEARSRTSAISGPLSGAQARLVDSVVYLAENLGRVPVLLLPCLRLPEGRLPEGNQAAVWGSLLPAVWSYMLAARIRGLGTAWTTLHLAYETEIAELLGIPHDARQGALIPTAYHLGSEFRPALRAPLATAIHTNGWG